MSLGNSELALARQVLTRGPVHRAELGERLGLSPASLTRLIRPFLERGLFVELGPSSACVGRPSKPLDIREDIGVFYGFKLTGKVLQLVVTDARANPLTQRSRVLLSRQPEAVAELVATMVEEMAHLPAAAENVVGRAASHAAMTGIGICLGGKVCNGRTVLRAPFLGWEDVDFAAMVEDATGLATVVDNDLVALTEGIHWFGSARDVTDFCVITIGAGVGWGLVVHDQIVNTPDTGLGLGGHIPLGESDFACPAGHHGCAYTLLSQPGLAQRAKSVVGEAMDYEELLARAAAGEAGPAKVVSDAANALGRFIALATNLTMSPTVVLGGEGLGLWDMASEQVLAAADAERDPDAAPLRVNVVMDGFLSWARGAAAMAVQQALARL
ncbi:MAG: ROK family protein [Propionibacteriaceae bacterium]|nr:ROK family protein [Propionibacteriaceae bacterium]